MNEHTYPNRDEVMGTYPLIIAGPCAVESREQILAVGEVLYGLGVHTMRCQLWKPRTEKESFQGVGLSGLPWLAELKERYGMRVATEIVDYAHIEATRESVDILWVGARNMQNFELLKRLGEDNRVVILKRGFIATMKEWLSAADYIGRDRVILCERGIRTGADTMRFTLDLNAALVAKHDHHMPVIVDPSHTAGRRDMVPHLAYAAIAAGLDGVVIEVHPDPEHALSDTTQQIPLSEFYKVHATIGTIRESLR